MWIGKPRSSKDLFKPRWLLHGNHGDSHSRVVYQYNYQYTMVYHSIPLVIIGDCFQQARWITPQLLNWGSWNRPVPCWISGYVPRSPGGYCQQFLIKAGGTTWYNHISSQYQPTTVLLFSTELRVRSGLQYIYIYMIHWNEEKPVQSCSRV